MSLLFTAIKSDGKKILWGGGDTNADDSPLNFVASSIIFNGSTGSSYAALKTDGSVATWGGSLAGGDSSTVASSLSSGVTKLYSTDSAFAALKVDGSVVVWGDSLYGGEYFKVNLEAGN